MAKFRPSECTRARVVLSAYGAVLLEMGKGEGLEQNRQGGAKPNRARRVVVLAGSRSVETERTTSSRTGYRGATDLTVVSE